MHRPGIPRLALWLLAILLLVAACAAPTAPPAEEPAEMATEPAMEEAPEPTAESAEAEAPAEGGTLVFLIQEDLETLNYYLTTAFITEQVYDTLNEPLLGVDADGNYYPILAAEIPTPENGSVSEDGTAVTWRLKEGLMWSDGEPVTSADLVHTWQAASDPESGSARVSTFETVEDIETPDDLTAVVHYSDFKVDYLNQWQYGLLPKHATGDPGDMLNWEWNRAPVGTGPFRLAEWASGDRIVVERNPNYHMAGKPHLDQVIFSIVPPEETRTLMMQRGEAHVMLWPGGEANEQLQQMDNVVSPTVPGIWNLQMFPNLSQPFDDDPGPEPPHPILGDLRVRQAIAMAIDKDRIINDVLPGDEVRSDSPFNFGTFACDIEPYPHDPEQARQLLEEAGWTDADGDGIREAQGAEYAEDGTELSLTIMGYTGFQSLELAELAMVDDLSQVGIDLNIQNEEFGVLFGGWSDEAARATGNFDILFYDTGYRLDPQQHIAGYFHSDSIPSEGSPGGQNYVRWANDEADALIEEAGSTPDLDVRKEAFCDLAQLIHDELPRIYILQFAEGSAFATSVQGAVLSTWDSATWNIRDWSLSE